MSTPQTRIRWVPKVQRHKIERLYQNDALGLVDETLIDDVGLALLLRCRSILMVTAGEARCPVCGGVVSFRGVQFQPDAPVPCSRCGWSATYAQFHRSWRHHDLYGGNAMPAFETYAARYPEARTARERLLLADALIHAFHVSLRHPITPSTRTAGENLIEGSKKQVVQLLDTLAYGAASQSGTMEAKLRWREQRRPRQS